MKEPQSKPPQQKSPGATGARAALVVLAAMAMEVVAFRQLWLRNSPLPTEVYAGTFESHDGGVALHYQPNLQRGVSPEPLVQADGSLSLPPGYAVVMPLAEGSQVSATLPSGARLPYVVVGSGVSDPDDPAGGEWLLDARASDVAHGGLALSSWQPSLPWHQDAARLAAVQQTCVQQAPATVVATLEQGHPVIRVGACVATGSLSASGKPMVALLAGPEWLRAERSEGHIQTRLEAQLAMLGPLVGASLWSALASWVQWGTLGALLPAVGVSALSLWRLPVAMAVWIAIFVTTVIGTAIMSRKARIGLGVFAMLGGGAWWLSGSSDDEGRVTARPGELPTCLLMGYSSVAGSALRSGSKRMHEALVTSCPGGAMARAWPAEVFLRVESYICRNLPPDIQDVAFYGGANDNLVWNYRTRRIAWFDPRQLVGLVIGKQAREAQWDLLFHESAERNRKEFLEDQIVAIEAAGRCAVGSGRRWHYFHDFLIFDLERGPAETRRAMRDARRRAVEASGGRYVDVYDAVADRVSVSWFNDFIHPSAVGHAEIGALMAERIAAAPAEKQ